jgi:16S rRNA processing protein RimM
VTSVLHLPAQDVFEIDTNDGVRLVPFVSDLVPEVDLSAGRIVVSDVAGLLTDADEPTADEPPADQPTTADPTTADQPADEPASGSRS